MTATIKGKVTTQLNPCCKKRPLIKKVKAKREATTASEGAANVGTVGVKIGVLHSSGNSGGPKTIEKRSGEEVGANQVAVGPGQPQGEVKKGSEDTRKQKKKSRKEKKKEKKLKKSHRENQHVSSESSASISGVPEQNIYIKSIASSSAVPEQNISSKLSARTCDVPEQNLPCKLSGCPSVVPAHNVSISALVPTSVKIMILHKQISSQIPTTRHHFRLSSRTPVTNHKLQLSQIWTTLNHHLLSSKTSLTMHNVQ